MRLSNNLKVGGVVALGLGAMLLAGGCKREAVSTYEIPKEDYAVKPFALPGMGQMGGSAAQEEARPELKWTLPKGWAEKSGGEQRMGNTFHFDGGEGKYADIRVIPLRAGPEIEQRSVNMWREELGLAELPVDQVKGEELNIPGAHGHFYDMRSEELKFGGKFKARTTAAVIEKDGTLYFVKMVGEDGVVTSQQDAFKDFLKSIRFESAQPAPTQVASAAPVGGSPETANWKTPAGWTRTAPGQMVTAAYKATKNGKSADITVVTLGGPAGGISANVNRWRGQVGLGPLDEAQLAAETKTVSLSDGTQATVADIKGPRRLYGLIVPRGGKTWFYKMIGDSEVIDAEANNLVEFAATAH